MNSDMGLEEIEAIRATSDAREVGGKNTNVRAISAYNTDSRVTPTVRSNGILMAQIAPKGGLFSGTSSVVQLDAWNYEDAVLLADDALYMNLPDMAAPQDAPPKALEEWKKRQEQLFNTIHQTFQDAIAYQKAKESGLAYAHNLMLEAVIPVLKQTKKLFVRAESEAQIITAIAIAQQYHLKMVIVGGQDAYLQTDLLKKNDVAVVLSKPHQLPRLEDDAIDLPFRMPKILEEAGIPYCFDMDVFWNERNLPFQAGTSVAYGLTKEQALKALSYYPAQILGIDKLVGSLEIGKEATLVVSEGDVLDMRTSQISIAYIQGRKIDLNNLHKELYEKFKKKYAQ
jgi:imidazolonepropionase-like amidohydrolase